MSFRSVFLAVLVAFALVISAFLIQRARPKVESDQPSAELVRATGKCAECHARTQYSVVHEYEMSAHAKKGVNCLDCHQPAANQEKKDHHGFIISAKLTAGNCRSCHENIYQQFLHSRHAAPSWAAIYGEKGLSPEQVNFSETYQPGGTRRPPHPSSQLEGGSAMTSGCDQCHSVGRPNADGTIGTCTACHTRHTSSVRIARLPSTCAQCHMGPDHSQIEIYEESKHGVMFHAQERLLNLDAPPDTLTTRDMFVPTCATCHMSGLNGVGVTHDPSERLSYYLANAITETPPQLHRGPGKNEAASARSATRPRFPIVSTPRPNKWSNPPTTTCTQRRTSSPRSRKDGVLSGPPFSQPIDFIYFDLWHYDGRTSKHGAFMGGADFVQWHGNYPILQKTVQLKEMAAQLRKEHGKSK